MTGLVRKAAVLAACGVIFGAAVAFAGVPSPGNSDTPLRINLVGHAIISGQPDGAQLFSTVTVTVRDLGNNPIANSSVVFDFSGNLSDTRIGDVQPLAGLTANCGTHGVSALTDVAGVATFTIEGGGIAGAPAHAFGAGKIYADGVLLGSVNVGLYDLNGTTGVDGLDLSLFGADLYSAGAEDRTDYDNSTVVDGLDLSVFGAALYGTSNASAATYCP